MRANGEPDRINARGFDQEDVSASQRQIHDETVHCSAPSLTYDEDNALHERHLEAIPSERCEKRAGSELLRVKNAARKR